MREQPRRAAGENGLGRQNGSQASTVHIKPGTYGEKIGTSKHIHFVTNGSGTVRIGG